MLVKTNFSRNKHVKMDGRQVFFSIFASLFYISIAHERTQCLSCHHSHGGMTTVLTHMLLTAYMEPFRDRLNEATP